eukprot:9470347-Alexandrium_andersonii.AAC.1
MRAWAWVQHSSPPHVHAHAHAHTRARERNTRTHHAQAAQPHAQLLDLLTGLCCVATLFSTGLVHTASRLLRLHNRPTTHPIPRSQDVPRTYLPSLRVGKWVFWSPAQVLCDSPYV